MYKDAQATILALGNKWCKDNWKADLFKAITILALGNKWCKDNYWPRSPPAGADSCTWE